MNLNSAGVASALAPASSDAECNLPCVGAAATEICGGGNRVSVYQNDLGNIGNGTVSAFQNYVCVPQLCFALRIVISFLGSELSGMVPGVIAAGVKAADNSGTAYEADSMKLQEIGNLAQHYVHMRVLELSCLAWVPLAATADPSFLACMTSTPPIFPNSSLRSHGCATRPTFALHCDA
jgi:hypothetical protein